jgi:hypothetical protein
MESLLKLLGFPVEPGAYCTYEISFGTHINDIKRETGRR